MIQVGTRIYVMSIAAVSQERVSVCTARKITYAGNEMDLVLTSKLTWLSCGLS